MMRIGQLAQRRIHNVEDYVLAGRTLNTGFVTVAMIATWFGAESLMTTTDEVATKGMRGAMLDPLGISLCLLLAGLFVAGPLWCAKLLTIPDFFRNAQRPGAGAKLLWLDRCAVFGAWDYLAAVFSTAIGDGRNNGSRAGDQLFAYGWYVVRHVDRYDSICLYLRGVADSGS
jgi:Na+(H+)/acetate symporter ActP